ncbi:DNA-3-methyladenine glycosylase [Ruminococcus sp.]|uniref:DNA-3-methyladenine glycosylase n=1 Tax=Ruminococcus sp. TaxID=41978 RepID=UPI003F0F1281
MKPLDDAFFHRDCLEVAPELVGKLLVHRMPDGSLRRVRITETEAYRGEEDKGCHASKGRTRRTELLYGESGIIYIYLCYGMHWLMNVVTGERDQPQGVLFRAAEAYEGPGKLTKYLQLDSSCNGKPLCPDTGVWVEDDGLVPELDTKPRVGIDYAGPEWAAKPWRFVMRK